MSICPICFRTIGVWSNDPILTPDGIAGADYVGFTTILAQHIKEIQDDRNTKEAEIGLTPTVFTPVDITNLYQNIITYIIELRTSTEAILAASGLTYDEYFNYDENGTDQRPSNHQTDWNDPSIEANKFQCKAIHIEDLRHFIPSGWVETWQQARIDPDDPYSKLHELLTINSSASVWDMYSGTFDVYADYTWWSLATQSRIYLGAVGHPHNATGAGTSLIDFRDKLFQFEGEISGISDINHIGSSGNLTGGPIIQAVAIPFHAKSASRLEIEGLDFNCTYDMGSDVILDEDYRAQLAEHKAEAALGGWIGIKVTLRVGLLTTYYITYYQEIGQNLWNYPTNKIEWIPDANNGRNLYDDFVIIYPSLDEATWNTGTIQSIEVFHNVLSATTWAGFINDFGAYIVKAYTEGATLNMDYAFTKIRLINRVYP
jgi:hypothetical protein